MTKQIFKNNDDRYITKFSTLTAAAQIEAIQRALHITEDQADQIRQKVINEMKQQESLFLLAHQKQHLDKTKTQRIQKIKLLCIRKKPVRKEGRVHRIIRTNLFATIQDLQNRNVSWRHISEYIQDVHKIKIPPQSIQRVFQEIEKEFMPYA